MLFSSMIFLWVFLPLVLLGNFIISKLPLTGHKRTYAKNVFLLFASLVFYAWGGIYYLLLMLFSITVNYIGGRLIAYRYRTPSSRRKCLTLVIIINLAVLFVFKYFNMIGEPLGLPSIVLPIGISFFTFQAMSYVIDVYRGTADVQDNYLSFALYVSFFPQLIAGPIVRYNEIAKSIVLRKETAELKASGIKRFCYGLGKKVLLANTFALTADEIWSMGSSNVTGLTAWLGMICYTLQIYYDFSGYSDMAIGLGRIFGFKFSENFNYPYIALSVQDFWRRWHISLSTWFKEYVYIPLGGNRKGLIRTLLNTLIVFFLTGVWHGANFTFFAWGLYYAILLIIERLFLGKLLKLNPLKFINRIYTLMAVMLAWVLFRSDSITDALSIIRGLFVFGPREYEILSHLSMKLILALIFGILFCGPIQTRLSGWYEARKDTALFMNADYVIQLAALILSFLSLIGGSYNPFIYFQF